MGVVFEGTGATEAPRAWDQGPSLRKGRGHVVAGARRLRQEEAEERPRVSPSIVVVAQKGFPRTRKSLAVPLGVRPKDQPPLGRIR